MAAVAEPLPAASPPQPSTPSELELDERGAYKSVVASQWQLMYYRFRRHKLAVISIFVVAFFYLIAIFCEFLAPMDPNKVSATFRYVPPQPISFVNTKGELSLRPGVYALKSTRNPETLRITYEVDKTRWTPISFFVQGDSDRFWGLWKTDIHLIGLSKADAATSLASVVPAATGGATAAATARPGATPAGAGAPGGTTGIGSIGGFGSGSPAVAPTVAPGGAGAPGGSTGIGAIGGFSSGVAAPTVAPPAVTVPAPAAAVPVPVPVPVP